MARNAAKREKGKSKGRVFFSWKRNLIVLFIVGVWVVAGEWFVHHSPRWIERQRERFSSPVVDALLCVGNPAAEITDSLGLTGTDAVYEYDEEAPRNSVFFAGAPKRVGAPAPDDIQIVDRGEFVIGWSPLLRHPVWVAYHVIPEQNYEYTPERPNFKRDKSVQGAPSPSSYKNSSMDRGHMAPNYAILTCYGPVEQAKTFLTSNIAPQAPRLNRRVWQDVEHRIAKLWPKRWGEIWVIVGSISEPDSRNRDVIAGTDIDIPEYYYQVVVAQEGLDIRAFAVIFENKNDISLWPSRSLISIDELEELSGFDFLPDLPGFIQRPLEAQLPTRLWPVRVIDVFNVLIGSHY